MISYRSDPRRALAVAAHNCQRHGVASRVRLLRGDLLSGLPDPVAMVVANLPYISRAEWETLAPEIRLFEPAQALDGGPDGLDPIRRLLGQVAQSPKRPQVLLLEIAATQGPAVIHLIRKLIPGAQATVSQDYAGLDRIVTVEL